MTIHTVALAPMKWIAKGAKAESLIQTIVMDTVFCAVIMITFVCLLVYEIYQQEKRTDRFLTRSQEQRRVNTSKTAWWGIQFVGVYFFSYFPSFVALGYRASGNLDIPDVFDYLFVILLPLLGFFNALVYFRPRYMAYKKGILTLVGSSA